MEGNVGEQIIVSRAESSQPTIEIKIKTLDSQTFTLQVDKHVPVPQLKEQVASVTGVQSAQQRLICRGKVLEDDQILSAYYVEDGHTLHLVTRQQQEQNSSHLPETDTLSASTGNNSGDEESPDQVVYGTINAAGTISDINRLVTDLLGSSANGSEGLLNRFLAQQPSTVFGLNGPINSSGPQSDPPPHSDFVPVVESLQSPVMPDLLTTLFLYLRNLREEFIGNNGEGISRNDAFYRGVIQDPESVALCANESGGVQTPEDLTSVISTARQLLSSEVAECLSLLEGLLMYQSWVTDPMVRSQMQSNAIRSGSLIQSLGSSLLDLGRAITTLDLGQTPDEAVVNVGNPVFVTPTGPNPIMVQARPGGNFGSFASGGGANGSQYEAEGVEEEEEDPILRNWQYGIPRDTDLVTPSRGSLTEQMLRTMFPAREPQPQRQPEPLNLNLPAAVSESFPTISENMFMSGYAQNSDHLQMEVDENMIEEGASSFGGRWL